MQKFEHNLAANDGGTLRPLAGALVTVTDTTTGLLAALYSDNGVTPLPPGPLTTDNTGAFAFYAADGKYTLTFSSPRFATFTREIILEDPADNPSATLSQLAAANGSELIRHNSMPLNAVLEALLSTGSYVLPVATGSVLGGVKAGAGVSVAADGTLSFTQYSLPIASAAVLGGVKIGAGLAIDGNGMLSTSAAGAMVLIGSATVGSPVANIDFLNIFTAAYDKYVVEIQNLGMSSASSLQFAYATGGVVDTSSVYSGPLAHNSGVASYVGAPVNLTTSPLIADGANLPRAQFTLELRNVNATTRGKGIGFRGSYMNSSAQLTSMIHEALYNGPNACSGFRITSFSTFSSGTVRVYGIKNS